MSHAKERKEKNCLNCNAVVAGRYCQVCGQENIETHENFGHLAGHFVSDIFHFDGMFFSTAKYLLFKPGFLTYEYVRGRRASYLNPIKMYVFISAIFFLFFLAFYKPTFDSNHHHYTADVVKQKLQHEERKLDSTLQSKKISKEEAQEMSAELAIIKNDLLALQKDTSQNEKVLNDVESPSMFGYDRFHSGADYDSLQAALPAAEKDSWLQRRFAKRSILIAKKFRQNTSETLNNMTESFFHHFSQIFFISLPFFALVLQLLYVRKKKFFYANHIIYAVHLYCAVFIFQFLLLFCTKAGQISYLAWMKYLAIAIVSYMIYYTYKAMRVFYEQGRMKTIVKWVLLNTTAFFIMIMLFIIMLLFTILTV